MASIAARIRIPTVAWSGTRVRIPAVAWVASCIPTVASIAARLRIPTVAWSATRIRISESRSKSEFYANSRDGTRACSAQRHYVHATLLLITLSLKVGYCS